MPEAAAPALNGLSRNFEPGRPHPPGALSLSTEPPEVDEVQREYSDRLPSEPRVAGWADSRRGWTALLGRFSLAHIGLFFVALALVIYLVSDPTRIGWYNHFVWQADAFLHGRFVISYPVSERAVPERLPPGRDAAAGGARPAELRPAAVPAAAGGAAAAVRRGFRAGDRRATVRSRARGDQHRPRLAHVVAR